MTVDELLTEAKLADLRRETAATAIDRVLTELYGQCQCGRRNRHTPRICQQHSIDPALFERFVWYGLGA
jgi:hypothetical protein